MFTVMTSKSLTTSAVWILDSRFWKRKGVGGKRIEVWMIGLIGFASSSWGEKDSTGFLEHTHDYNGGTKVGVAKKTRLTIMVSLL